MSFLLGDATQLAERADEMAERTSPTATRVAVHRLRDPRMWIGVLLVAVSALVGGRALAATDDTVELWAAARDLAAGAPIVAADLASTSVHFADAQIGDGYVATASTLVGRQLAQSVRAGQLIPSSAVGPAEQPTSELPVGVAAADLPGNLGVGDRVDVWVLPDDVRSGGPVRVTRVLRAARVAAVTAPQVAGSGGEREVLLAVESSPEVESVLAALVGARPVLVRVGD
jgi:hypothetical protein